MKVVLSPSARRSVTQLTLFVSSALLTGCSRSLAPVPVTSASAASVRTMAFSLVGRVSLEQTAITHVHTLPLYRESEQACKEKRYAEAADFLQRLGGQQGLTHAEITFVRQQRVLCLKDAGLPVPTSTPTSSPVSHAAFAPVSSRALRTSATASTNSLANADCGPRALLLVCNRLGVKTTLPFLRQKAGTTPAGTSLAGLATAAKAVGLKAEGVQVSREALREVEAPALAYVNGNHFLEIVSLSGKGEDAMATIHDPNAAGEETMSQERLLRLCSGYLLLIKR